MNELKKNTVEAKNQLKDSRCVTFKELTENSGTRIMFVGNSITKHGYKADIGWFYNFGMAASCEENDYFHICMSELKKKYQNPAFCICQVSQWEANYKTGEEKYPLYQDAQSFDADIIIMRAIENVPADGFDKDIFFEEYDKLLKFLNPSGKAKIIITTSFWIHPADDSVRLYAKEHNLPLCELGDLGEMDEMKAIGKFEHSGVANHPGDLGMKTIAERILSKMEEI